MYSNNQRYRVKKIFAYCFQGQGSDFRKRSGYTMLELMVAVAVIGILTSLAIAGSQALLPRLRLNSAAQQLHGDMQRCKMAAIRNNTECYMKFENSGSGSYTACFSASGASCSGDTILTRDFSDDDYTAISLNNANFPGGDSGGDAISFGGKGLPDSNGSVKIIRNSGDSRTVDVSITGRIKIGD